MGVTVIILVEVFILMKNLVVGAPYKDNGNTPASGAVYIFTLPGKNGNQKLQGETWTEDKKLTTSDMASGDRLGVALPLAEIRC